jgi:hypothetical protein
MAVSRTVAPNPMTAARQKKMFALMAQNGLADRVAGLAFLSKVVGREITSSKQLTKDNGEAVLKALEAMAAAAPSGLTPFDALMIVVKQAVAEGAHQDAFDAVAGELESGQITKEQEGFALARLSVLVENAAAGVSS